MKRTSVTRLLLCVLAFSFSFAAFSQDDDDDDSNDQTLRGNPRKSKILTGLYVGSYFANKYTANLYNGYGFDIDGNRNIFTNSFMHQKIINEYGGGYGQHDYIADELGVDQGRWSFNESDMPFNMRYTPGIMIGANFKIPLSKRTSVLINVNGSILKIEGNFTITTDKPNNPNPLVNNNVQTFVIRGSEQRLLFQLGMQQLFGSDDKFNFLVEAGAVGTLAKYDQNLVYINHLQIDLTTYVNQTLYPAPFPTKKPVGFGIGAFAGLGINIEASPKFNIQFLYSPSYEKINIGSDRKLRLQHGVGFRFYYKIREKQRVSTLSGTGQ